LGDDSSESAERRQSDPQSLRRLLRQELDWIVMKTLEKDRTRRYGTALALADDIQHYLAHEPVQAGPPGNWYRIRKYARRYRTPLCIAAGFVALLLAITILAVRGYYQESRLRSEIEASRRQIVEISENVITLTDELEKAQSTAQKLAATLKIQSETKKLKSALAESYGATSGPLSSAPNMIGD
jgi:eukaryotic-like serine/threonine-protein kinase